MEKNMKFQSCAHPTVGVEIELQLIDRVNLDLNPCSIDFLKKCKALGFEKVKSEIHQSMIEIETDICQDVKELRADLEETKNAILQVADGMNIDLASSGTHSFQNWKDRQIFPSKRYLFLYDKFKWLAQRMNIYGLHVHIGVSDREEVIALMNESVRYLPHLLALSASSPFWGGTDTGFQSCRLSMIETFPFSGIPPFFKGWDEYNEYGSTLLQLKAISSLKDLYWYIRPNLNYGTLEFRICDSLPTLEETVALAALVHCLVVWLGKDEQKAKRCSEKQKLRGWYAPHNLWNAARDGVDALVIIDDSGKKRTIKEDLHHLLEDLQPIAVELNCSEELAFLKSMIAQGSSAKRQVQQFGLNQSCSEVVDMLVEEFRTGKPSILHQV